MRTSKRTTTTSSSKRPEMATVRARGFSLVEILVVIIVLGILAVLGAREFRDRQQATARTSVVSEYVSDFSIVARAAYEYALANSTTWADNTRVDITFAQLRTAGFLPAGFTTRNTGDGTTPLGNTFVMGGQIDANDNVRVVVAESGNAHPQRLSSMGFIDANGVAQIKRQIAGELVRRGVGGATLAAGSTTATGGGSNPWTVSVAGFLPAAPGQIAVATLVGFPELEPEGITGRPNEQIDLGRCRPSSPTCPGPSQICSTSSQQVAAAVPAGRTVEGRWPHCLVGGMDTFYPVAHNSAVITLGNSSRDAQTFSDSDCAFYAGQRCNGCDPSTGAYVVYRDDCLARRTYWRYTDVVLNNGTQQQNFCRYESYFMQGSGASMQIIATNTTHAQNAPTSDDIFVCEPN